ncbi:hypothetical protein C8A05DRAFT_35041 [Staphylotrichum tortipilum]|uniref:Uncharacterized protein n=1 Tax=Staphylotrichum tortipilum TaxID=2831512 RepID=A0AAN6MII1_9PEZI|nr:hypothetical protein C8A05DRAFT_35041 [Staphylotrichum longicolle]
MGRWSYLDTDEERLPPGMTRVHYDAGTQVYTYRDASDGSYWEGAPGCRYGKLHRVRAATPPLPSITVPTTIAGDEAPYVLHDPDVPSDEDDYSDLDQGFSEKKDAPPALASPDKARIHTPHPHPALLNNLPATTTTLTEKDTSARSSRRLSGTTLASLSTDTSSLKRTGTLSRLARFLTSSSPSSSHPPPASTGRRSLHRRATIAVEPADAKDGSSARDERQPVACLAGAAEDEEEGDYF